MAIEILYAQSYMQTNGQMTVDILLKNPETASIVIGMDMQTTDIPPKVNGPRMVACIPANTPCYSIRYVNIPFTDPYRIYVKRCISAPNCATSGCATFSTLTDSTVMGEMVDFGSPGVSGVPRDIFGSPHPVPSNIQGTCAPAPPPVTGLNIVGVTTELSTATGFPGNEGWTRINVTATGSGMVKITVDGTELISDGPLNPGSSPFTYTYLKKLTAGTHQVCAIGSNTSCTTLTVPTLVAEMTVLFAVKGNGQLYIVKNSDLVATAMPGASVDVKFVVGDKLTLRPYPYVGSTFINLCDMPQTECLTTLPPSWDITGQMPQGFVASFTAAPPPPPPPTIEFTVSSDKTAIMSGDYVVFSGHYKTGGQKIGIYSNKGYITTVVTNAAGDYKVGSYVTISETTTQKLTVYACAEGIISGICPVLADKSNNITIDVAPMKYDCSGAPDYACIRDPTGKYTDPDSCRAECKAPPPPVVTATHAFVINLSPLSWANLNGLIAYLPVVSQEFAKAITLYGWLGWSVIESRMEDSKLVIYLRETAAVSGMNGLSETASKVRALALPTLAAIVAALGTIAAIALRFGYIILGFYIINLLTKAVEVAKTQADTEQIRTKTISDMCTSGELTPEQCSEALKPPPEKGLCETFGFSATACAQLKTGALVVGGLIGVYLLSSIVSKVAPKPTG